MLEIKNLNVHYGVIHALKDVSLQVPEGEIVALIGMAVLVMISAILFVRNHFAVLPEGNKV